jgi:hypothetical protein
MGDSFDVAVTAVHDHAKGLSGLAEELRGAFDAAGYVKVTDEAYGQTCQQVASMLNAVAEEAGRTILAGIDGLASAAAELRNSADTYTALDSGHARIFFDIGGGLA